MAVVTYGYDFLISGNALYTCTDTNQGCGLAAASRAQPYMPQLTAPRVFLATVNTSDLYYAAFYI